MHLTNYCINKTSLDYVNPTDEEILLDNQGSKRTLESLWDTLRSDEERDIDVEELKEGVAAACGKVCQIYAPMIEHGLTQLTNKMELGGKPFHILGLDVLIDENLKPWVLEVNDNPSLSIYFDADNGMGGKRHTDEDINLTDLYVNSQVVEDTIKLAKKNRSTLASTEEHRSLKKIHPVVEDEDNSLAVYNCTYALRKLFYDLAPIKNKASLTISGFEKLAFKPTLSDASVTKHVL